MCTNRLLLEIPQLAQLQIDLNTILPTKYYLGIDKYTYLIMQLTDF